MLTEPSLAKTEEFVRALFAGVVDKDGKPFADHCLRVAAGLPPDATDDERKAALLHDVIEDTAVTAADLRNAGWSERTVSLVERLSRKPEDGSYMDWIRSIAASGDRGLILIKLADNADNIDPARIAAIPAGESGFTRRYAPAMRILETALVSFPQAPPPMDNPREDDGMSMIERVARALAPVAWDAIDSGDTWAFAVRRSSSLDQARLAIGAMREPTPEMQAALSPVDRWSPEEAFDAWHRMIDAALAKSGEPHG